jgi:RNA polymerase sigma factor (sigma-70 family)
MDASEDRQSADLYLTQSSLFLRLKSTDSQPRELAWQEFHDRYSPVIAGFARNLGARPQDIDDIIQDVMLGFFARSPTFVYQPAKGRFRGYLKVCTLHSLQKRLGQNLKFQGVPLEEVDPESAQLTATWDDQWQQQQLKRAINAVREKYHNNKTFQAFERHVMNAESVESVCKALAMTSDSVYQAKTRVTAALRQYLRNFKEDEG